MDLNQKYRPSRWSNVVGQETAVTRLRNILASDSIPATFMFVGASGTGKTTLAKLLSDYLNCEKNTKCGKCKWCRSTKSDVIESNAANNRGIDDIRNLIEASKFKPRVGKYKIFIMNEVQQLTPAAESALLDFCENVPEHVIMIFTTMEPSSIHKAFRTRTTFFNLDVPTDREIEYRLRKINTDEGSILSKSIIHACAKEAAGCVRNAVQMLDACIQYCSKSKATDEKLEQLVMKNVISIVKDSEEELALDTLTALYKGDIKAVHRTVINVKQHVSFLMKLNYINMYILDSQYVGKHPMVWPTAANLEMLSRYKKLKSEVDEDIILERAYLIMGAINSIKYKLGSFMADARSIIMWELYSVLYE